MYSDLTYQLHFKNPESTEFLPDDFVLSQDAPLGISISMFCRNYMSAKGSYPRTPPTVYRHQRSSVPISLDLYPSTPALSQGNTPRGGNHRHSSEVKHTHNRSGL